MLLSNYNTDTIGWPTTLIIIGQLFLQIIADNASPDGTSLPSCSDSLWGPGLAVDQLGLVASPQDGIIATDKGSVSLEFKKTKPASVLCRLKRQGMKDKELAKCISEKDGPDSVQVIMMMVF